MRGFGPSARLARACEFTVAAWRDVVVAGLADKICVMYAGKLVEQGRILLAGPRPAIDSPNPGPAGFEGSLIVADFDSLEEAREWAGNDPYVLAGVYESVEVSPFIQVLP